MLKKEEQIKQISLAHDRMDFIHNELKKVEGRTDLVDYRLKLSSEYHCLSDLLWQIDNVVEAIHNTLEK